MPKTTSASAGNPKVMPMAACCNGGVGILVTSGYGGGPALAARAAPEDIGIDTMAIR